MNESTPEEPDHELLRRIQNREHDPDVADEAFKAFYLRHRDHVYDQVCFVKRKLGMKAIDEEDFVIRVFGKVWQSACKTYSRSKSNASVEERLSVRAWLGTITKNLIRDERSERSEVYNPDDAVERAVESETETTVASSHDSTELLRTVQSVLSERDAKVVWFKIEAYNPKTGETEPDPEAVKVFCDEIGISPGYLRKIYSRAITTLQEAMATVTPFIHK